MTYVLDRFEDNFAVLSPDDGGEQLILPRSDFDGRREGDIFEENCGSFVFNAELTMARKKRIRERFRKLVRRKPKTK